MTGSAGAAYKKRLVIALTLTGGFALVEVVGGIVTGP